MYSSSCSLSLPPAASFAGVALACVLLNLFTHLELCVHSSISLLVEQFALADPFPRVRVGHVREIGEVSVEEVLD